MLYLPPATLNPSYARSFTSAAPHTPLPRSGFVQCQTTH